VTYWEACDSWGRIFLVRFIATFLRPQDECRLVTLGHNRTLSHSFLVIKYSGSSLHIIHQISSVTWLNNRTVDVVVVVIVVIIIIIHIFKD